MTKEIIEQLKTKFEGLSDNVIGRVAKTIAKTVTTLDEVKTAVEGLTLQKLIESYADSRVTEASLTAVQNYESRYNLKDGAKVSDDNKVTKGGEQNPTLSTNREDTQDNPPTWAKALLEANKTLSDRLAKMEGERIISNRKQQLAKVVETLPDTLKKPYDRVSLDSLSDEDFNAFLKEVGTEVDAISTDLKAKGAVFGRPTAGSGNQGNGKLTKEQETAIAHRDNATSSEDEQPF